MKSEYFINKELFRKSFITTLEETYVIDFNESTLEQQYSTLVELIKKNTSNNWNKSKKNNNKKLYYFTEEVNLGRTLYTNIINSGIKEVIEETFLELNINLNDLLNLEKDFQSSNLSLFESLTTNNYASTIFTTNCNTNLEVKKEVEKVNLYGDFYLDENYKCNYQNYDVIEITSYESPIIGFQNNFVNTVCRWDTGFIGIKNDYAYISASLKSIFKKEEIDNIILNITDESSIVVVELMRILIDEYNYDWDTAFEKVSKCIVYNKTRNLTYDINKFKELIPRVYSIVEELNRRFNNIINDNLINMSNIVNNFNFVIYDYHAISHRKWGLNINNDLTNTLNEYCEGWENNPNSIYNLNKYISKRRLQKKFRDMKIERKKSLYKEINYEMDDVKHLLIKVENNLLSIIHILYLHNQLKYNISFKDNFTPYVFLIDFNHNTLLNLNNDSDTNKYLKVIEVKENNEYIEELIVSSVDVVDNTNTKYMLNGALSIDNLEKEEFNEFRFLLNEYNLDYDDTLLYFNSYKSKYEVLNVLSKDEVLWCKEMINTTLKSIENLSDIKTNKLNEEILKLNQVKINW